MDGMSFDILTRSLSGVPSRRRLLHALLGVGLGLGATSLPDAAEAKKKHRRKKKSKKAKPNAFGCLEVGDVCKNSDQCCSGICDGKKSKRKCRAHGTGTCVQGAPGLCTAPNPDLLTCNNSNQCFCIRTTGGGNFCYDARAGRGTACADCQKDPDCEALGFPPGTACAAVSEGRCASACEGGMMCMVPCGYEPPVPE